MPYIRMNVNTGDVDPTTFRVDPPSATEVKHWRWLSVTTNNLALWELEQGFPTNVPTNSTSIARTVVTVPLADWKKMRIAKVRREEESRFDALPTRLILREILVALNIVDIKASGNTPSAGQVTRLAGIKSQANSVIFPISDAAQAGVDAINAAVDHAGVEAALAAITWP